MTSTKENLIPVNLKMLVALELLDLDVVMEEAAWKPVRQIVSYPVEDGLTATITLERASRFGIVAYRWMDESGDSGPAVLNPMKAIEEAEEEARDRSV